jgi:F0F1-type ATP synthase beta subunit
LTLSFLRDHLPAIYNALKIEEVIKGNPVKVTGEVQQHLGGGRVRCVALGSTDGMRRGMDVVDTGKPLSVPVGKGLWDESSTFWAMQSTVVAMFLTRNDGRFTAIHRHGEISAQDGSLRNGD